MWRTFKTVVMVVALGAQVIVAPVATTAVEPTANQQGPNTLVFGMSTGLVYDSNVMNSQPPVSDVQYTLYPMAALRLDRPKWNTTISMTPGFSYSSANLPEYQALSLTANARLQVHPTGKLSLDFTNFLVSSLNPFQSLSVGKEGVPASGSANLNYLPRTNESASAAALFNLSPRTSLNAVAAYNFLSYQSNPNIPPVTQPFQESSSGQVTLGVSHTLNPRYSGTLQYAGQIIDAGQGLVRTVGHSVQFGIVGAPTARLKLSAFGGPQYVRNTYASVLDQTGVGNELSQQGPVWTWVGSFSISETFGRNQLSVRASKQLGTGNQYQGAARQSAIEGDYTRELAGNAKLIVFVSYNGNSPVTVARSAPRLSNNYSSSGAIFSKTFAGRWEASCSYWYLFQNRPASAVQLYSGNHNRVAFSLSYSLGKPIRQ